MVTSVRTTALGLTFTLGVRRSRLPRITRRLVFQFHNHR